MNTFTKIFRGVFPYRGEKAVTLFIDLIKKLDELKEFTFRSVGNKTLILLTGKEIAKIHIRATTQQIVLEVAIDSSGQQVGVLTNILTNLKIDWALGLFPFIPSHTNLLDLFNIAKEPSNEYDRIVNTTKSIKGNDTQH